MANSLNRLFGIEGTDLPPTTTPTSKQFAWVEESFVFDVQVGKQVPVAHSGEYVGTSVSLSRTNIFFLCILFCLGVMLSRLVYLQLIHGEDYAAAADINSHRNLPIPAERGHIYDRYGLQITKNIPNFSLAITPQDLPRPTTDAGKAERDAIISQLATITGKTEVELREVFDKYKNYSYQSIAILEDIDYETALRLQIAAGDLPGVHIQKGSKRLYLQVNTQGETVEITSSSPFSLSHILGYEGKLSQVEYERLRNDGYNFTDLIGKTGVEKTYETYLRGVYGNQEIEVDTRGRMQEVLSEIKPIPGSHVVLAIDAQFQTVLEQIMQRHLGALNKRKASAVAIDPRNGEVLALVSLPTFDANDFSGGINQTAYRQYIEDTDRPLFNRAIGGNYPSGSSIKPAVGAAALQEGIINANTSILSTGGVRVGQWFFPDWQVGGHGNTNLRKSLAQSVNTFYYIIGGGFGNIVGMGSDVLVSYLHKFGFGERSAIDLPGESAGLVPSRQWKQEVKKEAWYVGDTYNLSIGQGDLLVTPLQIANMTAAIANGGTLYRPHVVKEMIDPIAKQQIPIAPEVIQQQVVQGEHLTQVKLGMRDCVTSGSCKHLSNLPFAAAGKTGTAQWNRNKENHAWFTSFAPYNNPTIVLTVMVEESGEGGVISAPIARDFYQWWGSYRYLRN